MIKRIVKFIKYQLRFLITGSILGTSHRLMVRIIINNIFLELFSNNVDFDKSKKKWDWRYWQYYQWTIDPVAYKSVIRLDIPEKYVYAILTDVITKLIIERSVNHVHQFLLITRFTNKTYHLMKTIMDDCLNNIRKEYKTK